MGDADISDVLGLKASTSLTIRRRRVYLAIKCGKWAWQLPSTLALSAFSYFDRKHIVSWTFCLNTVDHAEIEIKLLHGEFAPKVVDFSDIENILEIWSQQNIYPYMEILPRRCFLSENRPSVMALDQFVNAVQTLSSQVAWLCHLSPAPPDSTGWFSALNARLLGNFDT